VAKIVLSAAEKRNITELVQHAEANRKALSTLLGTLFNTFSADDELMEHVHSMKWRVKDAKHLREKITRKLLVAKRKGEPLDITKETLFNKINDLAGFRILHLHTRQFEQIDRCLKRILDEQLYRILEGPAARTWDDETREYFQAIHTEFIPSKTLYTSVHYVISPNQKTPYTCEIQVRTLAEELWGEVDHTINYPHPSKSVSCREQIKVLARVTSSCSRLVDAIFISHDDHLRSSNRMRKRRR
jgi:ppGpp synthetase/RelA/SpoT-type nucleotidyltranferase